MKLNLKLRGDAALEYGDNGELLSFAFARSTPESPAPSGYIIPADRLIDWSLAGIPGGIPKRTAIFRVIPAGASLATVQAALRDCPSGMVVKLSAGKYFFNGDLDCVGVDPEVTLRGANPLNARDTDITFSAGRILMRPIVTESALSTDSYLTMDAMKGENTASLASVPEWIIPGHIYLIDQLNDPDLAQIYGQEGRGSVYRALMNNGDRGIGQTIKVVSKTETKLTFEVPLYIDYTLANAAQIACAGYRPEYHSPLRGFGIEDLSITASFSAGGVNAISMESCDGCWLDNVVSTNVAGGCHVWTAFSYGCEIRNCTFDGSHLYGSGQGYGVALYHASCGFLVENNTFRNLHNPVQLNYGSSGNVIGYNLCEPGRSDSVQNPSISTHGCHAFKNLFEGNYCADKFLFDFTHGSGGENVILRNRIVGRNLNQTKDQCCISIEKYNRDCTVAGNVLGERLYHNVYEAGVGSTSGFPITDLLRSIYKLGGWSNYGANANGGDSAAVMDLIRHGNFDVVTNGVVWDPRISSRVIPVSLYRDSKPDFLGDRPWPLFDPLNPRL